MTLNATDPDPNETLTNNARVYTNKLETQAYFLEQRLGLTFTGNYFLSSFGVSGMWLQSNNGSNTANGGWYFLLSDGTLHQWDGVNNSSTAAGSPVVATLDATYYANPALLLNAVPTPAPLSILANVSGNTVTFSNFNGFTGQLLVVASVSDGIFTGCTSFYISVT